MHCSNPELTHYLRRPFGKFINTVSLRHRTIIELRVDAMPSLLKATMLVLRMVRAPFFTATIAPILVGTSLSWKINRLFDLSVFLCALFSMLLLHAAANMLNDYFDHLSGADWFQTNPVKPFTGGSRVIQEGLVKPRTMLLSGVTSLILGSLLGLWLVKVTGVTLLLIGIVGVFLAYFYTAPPIMLAHRGFGELAVGLAFGILPTIGAYYVQSKGFDWRVLIASLPIALLIVAVLWVNEIPDAPSDERAGKRNLVVRLGKKASAICYCLIVTCAFISLPFIALALHSLSPLLGLVTFPTALLAMANVVRHVFFRYDTMKAACAMTVLTHFAMGILLSISYAL